MGAEKLLIALGMLLMSVADCGHNKPPLPPPIPGGATCEQVCANVHKLNCPNADACSVVCTPNLQRNHPEFTICATAATSCDEIVACDAQ